MLTRRLILAVATVVLLGACAPPGTTPQVGSGTGFASRYPGGSASPFTVPTCAGDGIRITMRDGDAAMGLRVSSLDLVNCGTKDYELGGFPLVRALDDELRPIDVRVLDKAAEISVSLEHFDAPPAGIVLAPGETASAAVTWRNTYTDAVNPPVSVPVLTVAAQEGRAIHTVPAEHPLDLGSTGRFAVSPWRRS